MLIIVNLAITPHTPPTHTHTPHTHTNTHTPPTHTQHTTPPPHTHTHTQESNRLLKETEKVEETVELKVHIIKC